MPVPDWGSLSGARHRLLPQLEDHVWQKSMSVRHSSAQLDSWIANHWVVTTTRQQDDDSTGRPKTHHFFFDVSWAIGMLFFGFISYYITTTVTTFQTADNRRRQLHNLNANHVVITTPANDRTTTPLAGPRHVK
jgi:hypothetical protein